MYISTETDSQTEQRLRHVIRTAKWKVFENDYCFKEIPVGVFQWEANALAAVGDGEVWSFLVPAAGPDTAGQDTAGPDTENFKVFSFHFEAGLDNSGFVGWLATRIKKELGAGVFVVCGQNSARGGIFDYWGVPVAIAADVIGLVRSLRTEA
jgi:Family of unknown function (DUF6196)